MALKSMKLTPEQRSEEVVDMKDPKPPVYPWGLTQARTQVDPAKLYPSMKAS